MKKVINIFLIAVVTVAAVTVVSGNFSLAADPYSTNEQALSLMEKGEYDKAIELLQNLVSSYPYEPALKKNLAEAYALLGQHQMHDSDFEAAAATFDRARELSPDTPRFYMMRGIAFYYGKYPDAARNELERARGIGGDSPDILFYLAKLEYDEGNLQTSLEFLDKALQLKPGFTAANELATKIRRELSVEKATDRSFSSRFMITYDSDMKSNLAGDILSTLEEAYNTIGSDLMLFPSGRIPVILYTRKDFRTVTEGPDWSGGLYDGKIRLPIGGADQLSPQLKGVLFHEYTHVVVQEMTHGNCPTWLNEGLAELEGRKMFDHPLQELARAAKSGTVIPISRLEGSFTSLGNREAALAYQQSYSLVRFMVNAYGWPKISELLQQLGKGSNITDAMKKVMGDFGLDYEGVIDEWRTQMKKEYNN